MSGPIKRVEDPKQLDQCLLGIARGDRKSFETLYGLTAAGIYAFALSIVKHPQDAQDILHDCYLKIYSAAGSYRSDGKPMAWILTVAKNLCYARLRELRKTAEIAPEEWDLHLPPEEDLTREDRIVLQEGMKILSDEERQIVLLHAVSDLKHREIAELLELPLSTVLSKYRRALKKLENVL